MFPPQGGQSSTGIVGFIGSHIFRFCFPNGSVNAEAPLTVVNTRGFDLPKTGDNGTMMITLAGVLLMAGSVTVLLILNKKKLH